MMTTTTIETTTTLKLVTAIGSGRRIDTSTYRQWEEYAGTLQARVDETEKDTEQWKTYADKLQSRTDEAEMKAEALQASLEEAQRHNRRSDTHPRQRHNRRSADNNSSRDGDSVIAMRCNHL